MRIRIPKNLVPKATNVFPLSWFFLFFWVQSWRNKMKVLNIIVFHLTRAFHPPVFRKKNWITHIICSAFTKNKTLFSPKLPGNFFGIFLQFVRIFLLELFWNLSRTKCSSGLTSQEENIEQHWRWVGCVTFFCQKNTRRAMAFWLSCFELRTWSTAVPTKALGWCEASSIDCILQNTTGFWMKLSDSLGSDEMSAQKHSSMKFVSPNSLHNTWGLHHKNRFCH